MRIENTSAIVFTIFDAPRLDPITVVLQDLGPSAGRLIVECYGSAWSGYWGAMGDRNLFDFLCVCSPQYISGKMHPTDHRKMTKREEAYLDRVVNVVLTALRSPYFD